MNALWHWLTDWRPGDHAFTPQAPSYRAHPQDWTAIMGVPEGTYLRWLMGSRPWRSRRPHQVAAWLVCCRRCRCVGACREHAPHTTANVAIGRIPAEDGGDDAYVLARRLQRAPRVCRA
jgi:hypothetical protein